MSIMERIDCYNQRTIDYNFVSNSDTDVRQTHTMTYLKHFENAIQSFAVGVKGSTTEIKVATCSVARFSKVLMCDSFKVQPTKENIIKNLVMSWALTITNYLKNINQDI